MKSPVNLELIFPIKDAPSASFMSFKASCLRDAGIITETEKHWVDARVLSVLNSQRSLEERLGDGIKFPRVYSRDLPDHPSFSQAVPIPISRAMRLRPRSPSLLLRFSNDDERCPKLRLNQFWF